MAFYNSDSVKCATLSHYNARGRYKRMVTCSDRRPPALQGVTWRDRIMTI